MRIIRHVTRRILRASFARIAVFLLFGGTAAGAFLARGAIRTLLLMMGF